MNYSTSLYYVEIHELKYCGMKIGFTACTRGAENSSGVVCYFPSFLLYLMKNSTKFYSETLIKQLTLNHLHDRGQ